MSYATTKKFTLLSRAAARVAVVCLLVVTCLASCGTDPDDDSVVTAPEDGVDDGATPVDGEISDPDADTDEDSGEDIDEIADIEDIDDVETDTGDIEETDAIDGGGEVCTTVCDCTDQVGEFCQRPPGVCFPVTIPQDRQYCCTSNSCPTGEICEQPDGSGGVCP